MPAIGTAACDRVAQQYQEDLEEQPNVVGAIALADSAVTVHYPRTGNDGRH